MLPNCASQSIERSCQQQSREFADFVACLIVQAKVCWQFVYIWRCGNYGFVCRWRRDDVVRQTGLSPFITGWCFFVYAHRKHLTSMTHIIFYYYTCRHDTITQWIRKLRVERHKWNCTDLAKNGRARWCANPLNSRYDARLIRKWRIERVSLWNMRTSEMCAHVFI